MNAISPIPSSIYLRSRGATKKGLITSTGECGTDCSAAARIAPSAARRTGQLTSRASPSLSAMFIGAAYDQTWSKVPFWNGKASAFASRISTRSARPQRAVRIRATSSMVDPNVAFSAVRASRGKMVRAEPVAALYQQGRIYHIGTFPHLEDQMTNFTSDIDRAAAGYSPDRVDALVWAFSELLVKPMNGEGIYELYRRRDAEAAAQRSKPQPTQTLPRLARWSGSRRRRRRAEPSSGIV